MNKRKTVHINLYSTFQTMKLSADNHNTTYTIGASSEIQEGTPDIKFNSIVFIKDTHQIWTHGELYDFASKSQLSGKVNNATFGQHTNNSDIHVSAEEKSAWNAKMGEDEERIIAAALNDLNERLRALENA